MTSFIVGLDLGQSGDPTALSIVETIFKPAPRMLNLSPFPTQDELRAAAGLTEGGIDALHMRHLERIKLNTPYPAIVERVAKMLATKPLDGKAELVVDATGVGRPVIDMMRDRGLDPVAVTITSGNDASGDGRNWKVPKRDLVVGLQVLLQEARLKIAGGLPEAKTLVSELMAFKVKIDTVTAHDSYNAREGAHDDLVLSAALACWWALRTGGVWFI